MILSTMVAIAGTGNIVGLAQSAVIYPIRKIFWFKKNISSRLKISLNDMAAEQLSLLGSFQKEPSRL
jgi:hypothetical protein